jgi:hypothetical protein
MAVEQEKLNYGEILRVLGHFIQQERLTDISILEYADGWIIQGLTFEATSSGFTRSNKDFVLSHADLKRLHDQFKQHRKEIPVQKSRWLR